MFPSDENKADYVRFRKILANQVVVAVFGGEVHAFDYGTSQGNVEVAPPKCQRACDHARWKNSRRASRIIKAHILETKTGRQLGSIPVSSTGVGFEWIVI